MVVMTNSPADWQLPPGVDRALWDYVHNAGLARVYDAALADSSLFSMDLGFARRYFDTPGRLIDLGCGTGRLLIDFAKRGFPVLGVDLSQDMLRVAAEKAARVGACVQLLKANLVELEALADGSFDYAACLFSTLGMVDGAAQRRRVIEHVCRLLKPGGKFLLHVHNRWFNFWDKQGRKWLLADIVRSLRGCATAGDRAMPVHQGVAGLKLHHFTRREALRLLDDAGLRITAVHPVSVGADGRLPYPAWFGWLRAYGYLLVAARAYSSPSATLGLASNRENH
jgi:SAM-dependent methyltransferase